MEKHKKAWEVITVTVRALPQNKVDCTYCSSGKMKQDKILRMEEAPGPDGTKPINPNRPMELFQTYTCDKCGYTIFFKI